MTRYAPIMVESLPGRTLGKKISARDLSLLINPSVVLEWLRRKKVEGVEKGWKGDSPKV